MEPVKEDWHRAVAICSTPMILSGCASAVARWSSQGKGPPVLATSGEAGIAGMPPDTTRPLHEEEQRRAQRWSRSITSSSADTSTTVEYGVQLRSGSGRSAPTPAS